MNSFSINRTSSIAQFNNSTVKMRSYDNLVDNYSGAATIRPSAESLLQVHRLREALTALKPGKIRNSSTISAQSAFAVSSPLQFSSLTPARISSVEEINTHTTSFSHIGPTWIGSTKTAPWSGLGSTATATVGGNYDGSNGDGTLKFQVSRGGTHGKDNLQVNVYADDGEFIERIRIRRRDPVNKVYELSNGLTVQFGEGDLVKRDYFEVDTSVVSTSYTPNQPGWTGSTAVASISGSYDGSNGSGDLTFRVVRGGVHGEDDIRIRVYDPEGESIETIRIDDKHDIDKVYTLDNGLKFQIGEGELNRNDTFNVSVDANDPGNYTSDPQWNVSTATASLTGTYDGSNGTGTLTFQVRDGGAHGEDDIEIRVYAPDGSRLETIEINEDDPIDKAYELSNGLSVTFSAGDFIRNQEFTVDVESGTNYSTTPNPVKSTATPWVKGVYDGSLGTDILEFTVTGGGNHGTDDLSMEVRTSDGTLIDTIDILATDSGNKEYTLSNGLTLSLGDGKLEPHETFQVSISHLVPTSVDPDRSFDGVAFDDPKLEYQFKVTDGSFTVNGNSIDVFANDSINSVLDRINSANIGVTASFDAATERIVMTQDDVDVDVNNGGDSRRIVLANDTSGFLAATKLKDAQSTQSSGGDETTILSQLDMMSDVRSGMLEINGKSISIDVDRDSIQDVISRIEIMVPEVDADFDEETGQISIEAIGKHDLEISNDETGFFAAIGIKVGLYDAVESRNVTGKGLSYHARHETALAMVNFAKQFNAVFENKFGGEADAFIQKIREELKSTVSQAHSQDESRTKTDQGFVFDFKQADRDPFRFIGSAHDEFTKSLKTSDGAQQYNELFFETEDDDGLVDRMLNVVIETERALSIELAGNGRLIDVWA